MATVAAHQLPHTLPFDLVNEVPIITHRKPLVLTALPALQAQLSREAVIYLPEDEGYEASIQRFSDYKRPTPGAVVCPNTENDIVATVKWASSNNVRFLARAGGHGWSMTLAALGPEGILINLRAMNTVRVNMGNGTATIAAGATTGEVINAAQDAKAHIVATACDGVGAIPSIMGGGIGNHVSNFGLASDNMVSARIVTHDGSIVNASATENSDLFWGLRGAGHSFGIVSELTVKAYPQINKGIHWSGMLGFPGSREAAEDVVRTVEAMGILSGQGPEGMSCTIIYGRPSPTYEATVLLKLSFNGSAAAAESAFAPLYAMTKTRPASIQNSEILPASELNESKDSLCREGGAFPHGNRPVHSTSLPALDATAMGKVYEHWESFTTKYPNAKESVVRVNCYDYRHVRDIAGEDSAFTWRQNPINVLQYSAYTDPSLDEEVQEHGKRFRKLLLGEKQPNVVMSFATGDEGAQAIYGARLEKLRALKQTWDPKGAFSFYNSC